MSILDIVHKRFPIAGPLLLKPPRHRDRRGFFSESYRQDIFAAAIGAIAFVQDNHSRSYCRGTLRGLHFQRPPAAQSKLLRVARGAALDVVVDVREGSPTYGEHVTVELSEDNGLQLWVPKGFLHGFCTLTEDVEFIYKVDAYFAPESDGSVAFDDPDLGIKWPFQREQIIISEKDAGAPLLRDIPPPFPRI